MKLCANLSMLFTELPLPERIGAAAWHIFLLVPMGRASGLADQVIILGPGTVAAMVAFDGNLVRLQQLHVARPVAGHGIDDDDVGHVFKVMQRIEAAIAAIDDLGAGALHHTQRATTMSAPVPTPVEF